MPVAAHRPDALTAIRTDLGAIFVSLELSRSKWLITSLSPGAGEKMSKHAVAAGDVVGMLARFAELNRKAEARTGKCFPIIVVQEAGLDGFWIHGVLQAEGIESHVVDPASIATSRRRRQAKTDKIDGEALVRALLAYKRGEPRVCAMLRVPTPEEEDRRRLSRERKALTNERTRHVNRIKGLLFAQGVSGYEPLRRDRRRCLEALKTGDGHPLPDHLKQQIDRELERLELLMEQIKAVEAERDAMLATEQSASPAPAMLLDLKGIGQEFAAVLWTEGLSRHYDNRRQLAAYAGLPGDPLAKRLRLTRPGRFEIRQSKAANYADPARVAMAAPSIAIGALLVVQGAGEAERRAPQEGDDCGARPQATRGAVEIRQRRRRHRGGGHEERLMPIAAHPWNVN
ncbi:IS110 family transposase [Mesorhizobium sp. M0816]